MGTFRFNYEAAKKKWDRARGRPAHTFRPPSRGWSEFAAILFSELGTPMAIKAAGLLAARDYMGLATLSVDPSAYTDGEILARDLQAVDLLRKFPGLPGTSQHLRAQEALAKGSVAEQQCLETNRRLRAAYTYGSIKLDPVVETIVLMAQRKIRYVLGSFELKEWLDSIRWGPGGSSRCKNPWVSPYHKFSADCEVTQRAAVYSAVLMEADPTWATDLLRREPGGPFTPYFPRIPGNTVTTVPKTALTDRLIAVEPHWNILFQLGVGQMIRRRLKRRAGLDLDTQERNQMLAKHSSIMGDLSTIDLSMASDTVSSELIRVLFDSSKVAKPDREDGGLDEMAVWYKVLTDLRSPQSKIGKQWHYNHKFSSMGNGFTFELETLVFWAIAQSAEDLCGTKNLAAVYGDDIIVTTQSTETVLLALDALGFTPNAKKSFTSGPFRESCGVNSFRGRDVTPFRLTDWNNAADIFVAHNAMKARGYEASAKYLLSLLPRELVLYGPRTAGDSVLHSENMALWNFRVYGLVDQWFFWSYRIKALTFSPEWVPVKHLLPALLASWTTLPKDVDRIQMLLQGKGLDSPPPHGTATLRGRGTWRVSDMLVDARSVHESCRNLIPALPN